MGEADYYVLPGEPGIFCEIYLPKKALYQGILYESLTQGFKREAVTSYLRERRGELNRFFEQYGTSRLLGALGNVPDDFDPKYAGYSMYEVDGVFHDGITFEERTQVVRVIFRFDAVEWSQRFQLQAKDIYRISRIFFRNQSSKIAVVAWHYSKQHKSDAALDDKEAAFLKELSTWHDRVALFVFGFLVHKICLEINRLVAETQVAKAENEIWVTQFWNININRVVTSRVSEPLSLKTVGAQNTGTVESAQAPVPMSPRTEGGAFEGPNRGGTDELPQEDTGAVRARRPVFRPRPFGRRKNAAVTRRR